MSRSFLLFVAMLAGHPRSACAQGTGSLDAEVRRLERVVDSLRHGFGEVSSLAAAPEVARVTPRHDDLEMVEAGGLRLRTNRSPLPVAEGADLAWQLLSGYFGDVLDGAPMAPLVVQGLDPDSTSGEWDDVAEITVHWDLTPDQLASRIVDARAPGAGDSLLVNWLGGPPRPVPAPATAFAVAYHGLVLSPYTPGRDCALGAVDACRAALLLLPDTVSVARAYPTARDRRQAATTLQRSPHGPALRPLFERCLVKGEDAGCVAVIEAFVPATRPAIAPALARRTLLEYALHTGGRGAYARLQAARGRPMEERLALAARLPLDSLLVGWRAGVLRARGAGDHPSAGVFTGAVAWVALLAFGATRSSRWRAA